MAYLAVIARVHHIRRTLNSTGNRRLGHRRQQAQHKLLRRILIRVKGNLVRNQHGVLSIPSTSRGRRASNNTLDQVFEDLRGRLRPVQPDQTLADADVVRLRGGREQLDDALQHLWCYCCMV